MDVDQVCREVIKVPTSATVGHVIHAELKLSHQVPGEVIVLDPTHLQVIPDSDLVADHPELKLAHPSFFHRARLSPQVPMLCEDDFIDDTMEDVESHTMPQEHAEPLQVLSCSHYGTDA